MLCMLTKEENREKRKWVEFRNGLAFLQEQIYMCPIRIVEDLSACACEDVDGKIA
jgi:hypothetical protein